MGGYGSGRWGTGKAGAKTLVESCWVLDINWLVQEGVVRPDQYRQGGVSWTRNEEKVASIGYEVNAQGDGGTLRLTYTVGRDGQEKIAQNYVVPLVGPARDLADCLRGAALVVSMRGVPARRPAVPPPRGEALPPSGRDDLRVPPLLRPSLYIEP